MSAIVKVLTPDKVAQFGKVIARAFLRNDVLAIRLKPDEAGFGDFFARLASASLCDGITCAAFHPKTSQLIGGAIAYRVSNEAVDKVGWPPIEPIVQVLTKLKPPRYIEEADPKTVLHLFVVGGIPVDEGGIKGVSDATLRHRLGVAKAQGIRYVVTELASPITQHVYLGRFGFRAEGELYYGNCGIAQFNGLEGKAVLGVLHLDKYK